MLISNNLIENIGQDELTKYLKKNGITENKTGVDFQHWLSDSIDDESIKDDFEKYCYNLLMYGKRKLIRSYEIKNTRVLKDDNKWLTKLKKDFQIETLNFNNVLTTFLQPGEEWKISAIKTEDDEKGDLKKISILFQCYVCKSGNIETCTYIPVEVDLQNKILLIKSWRRLGLESDREYKYNFLMDKVFEWLSSKMGIFS